MGFLLGGDAAIDNRLRLEDDLAILRARFENIADIETDLLAYPLGNHHLIFVFHRDDGHVFGATVQLFIFHSTRGAWASNRVKIFAVG